MSRFTRRLTSVRVEYADGSGMTLGPSEGDLTLGVQNANNAEQQPVYDRDVHDGFTVGRDLVQAFSITIQCRNETLTSAVEARLWDFIYRTGFFAGAPSLDDTIPAFRMIMTYDDGTVSTTLTYPLCRAELAGPNDGQPSNTLTLSGTNHAAPVRA